MHNNPFTLTDENIVYIDTQSKTDQHTMASFKVGSLELDVIINASISTARRNLDKRDAARAGKDPTRSG